MSRSERTERVDFPNPEGEVLSGRLEMPPGEPRAYAVFAHCFTCGKNIAAASRISRALSERGIAVLRFDFTGLGNSDGDFANTNFSSNVEDLVAAADHLREQGNAPRLIAGHSLGGAAALVAATRIPEIVAVASIAAPSEPSHVRRLLAGEIEEIEAEGCATVSLAGREFKIKRQFLEDLDEHRMEERLRGLSAALMVLHSPRDTVVGLDNARRIYEVAPHPKSFVSLDRADHLLSSREDAVWVAGVIGAWAARYV